MGATEELVRRSARVLTGFMTHEDANLFAGGGLVIDPAGFLSRWQQQIASIALPPSYAPPTVAAVPLGAVAHTAAVCANPMFALDYPNSEIKMVELGKLIACQWWADTHVSDGVHGTGVQGPQPTLAEVLERCLPVSIRPPAQAMVLRAGPNDMRIYSMNNTFRVEGPSDPDPAGRITFAIGNAPNLMLVREHAGRLVLTNGYHRAWFLRSRNVDMVPAVVVPASTQEEVVPGPGFIQAPILFGPRPPTVNDFFDDTLSMNVDTRSTMTAIRISAESLSIPRLLV